MAFYLDVGYLSCGNSTAFDENQTVNTIIVDGIQRLPSALPILKNNPLDRIDAELSFSLLGKACYWHFEGSLMSIDAV